MKNDFSKILRNLRNEKKLSQKYVAEILNISQQTYSHYENGDREPDIKMLINIANFYRVSLDILMGRYTLNETTESSKKHCS